MSEINDLVIQVQDHWRHELSKAVAVIAETGRERNALAAELEQTQSTLNAALEGRQWQLQRALKAEAAIRDMLDGDCLPGCRTEYASGCTCWEEKARRALRNEG